MLFKLVFPVRNIGDRAVILVPDHAAICRIIPEFLVMRPDYQVNIHPNGFGQLTLSMPLSINQRLCVEWYVIIIFHIRIPS